jgi:hypothetical protein
MHGQHNSRRQPGSLQRSLAAMQAQTLHHARTLAMAPAGRSCSSPKLAPGRRCGVKQGGCCRMAVPKHQAPGQKDKHGTVLPYRH